MKIKTLECVERTVRASHDGTEIVRLFYVDPYEAYPIVMAALLGGIDRTNPGTPLDVNGKPSVNAQGVIASADPDDPNTISVRRKPSQDSYVPECYCTDCWVDQVAREAMSSATTFRDSNKDYNHDYTAIELRDYTQGFKGMDAGSYGHIEKEVPRGVCELTYGEEGSDPRWQGVKSNAGCYIRAVYKPLICQNPGDTWTPGETGITKLDMFDFVDPQLHPTPKVVPCGAGLKYVIGGAELYMSVGSEGVMTQPLQQFTIRRIMCPSVPTKTINRLAGKVNSGIYKFGKFMFYDQTLRFDACEVYKRAVPDENGNLTIWYDILYVFTWNPIYDKYWTGTKFDYGYVGWNYVLGCPMQIGTFGLLSVFIINEGGVAGAGEARQAPVSYYPVGWKESLLGDYRPLYLTDKGTLNGVRAGTSHGFYDLFNPASE